MKTDFRTRNYSHLILSGLRRRWRRARTGREIMTVLSATWNASPVTVRLFLIGLILSTVAVLASAQTPCQVSDGSCAALADAKVLSPVAKFEFTATAVFADTGTICGKNPETGE